MQFLTTASLVAVAVAASAPVVTTNPNTRFVADFPFAGPHVASGFVVFAVGDSGQVNVHVDLTKLPATGGEFSYKIHDRPVGWGAATCDSAGAVFDPYHAGNVDCDALADDSRCPVGDLSGKHGRFTATCFEHSYIDPYLLLDPALEAYIGGRSVVVYHDGQVLACATIQAETEGDQNGESGDSVVELPLMEVALPTAVPPIGTDVIVTEEETIETSVETIETSVETIETSVDSIKTSLETIETSLDSTDSLAETTFPSKNSTVASTLTSEVSGLASSSAGSVPPEVTQETNMGLQLALLVAAMVAMVAMLL